MSTKNSNVLYIITTVVILAIIGFVVINSSNNSPKTADQNSVDNIEFKNEVQYITVKADNGYSPSKTVAKAGIRSKLVVVTEDTYDCSIALMIRSIGYQKVLASTAREEIDLSVPKTGQTIQGVCAMGMYSFKVKFE